MSEPVLQTGRLTLRPIEMRVAAEIQRLAGAREIADGTLTIPHPFSGFWPLTAATGSNIVSPLL